MYFLMHPVHMSLISFSVMPLMVSVSAVTKSTLDIGVSRSRTLLCVDDSLMKFSLHVTKENLNRIQPRTVLSIEHYVNFKSSTHLQDFRVVVELCVVHQQHYSLGLGTRI